MKFTLPQIFNQAYVYDASKKTRIFRSIFFGFFVFVFLFVFQPFGIGAAKTFNLLLLSASYGLCTTFVMLLLNVFITPLFPNYFNEEKWTVGREIFWVMLNIFIIGFVNAVFSSISGIWLFSLKQFLFFEIFTLLVSVFPVSALILMRANGLNKKFHKSAETLNGKINSGTRNDLNISKESDKTKILLIGSNSKNESLSVSLDNLVYINSSDNYIEVVYNENGHFAKTLLRNSLKSVQDDLKELECIYRCHKSYIVNLKKVIHISGNAQGYKLHLKGSSEQIPVSRNCIGTLRQKFTSQ